MEAIRNQRGFTLVELIVVIVVLGIISAVAIPKYTNMANDATAASNMAEIGGLRSALAMRFGQQLVREGDTAASNDVIGSTAVEAPITKAQIEALLATSVTLGGVAGTCGTPATWTGLAPGNPPVSTTWTLTCGPTASDPISIAGP